MDEAGKKYIATIVILSIIVTTKTENTSKSGQDNSAAFCGPSFPSKLRTRYVRCGAGTNCYYWLCLVRCLVRSNLAEQGSLLRVLHTPVRSHTGIQLLVCTSCQVRVTWKVISCCSLPAKTFIYSFLAITCSAVWPFFLSRSSL